MRLLKLVCVSLFALVTASGGTDGRTAARLATAAAAQMAILAPATAAAEEPSQAVLRLRSDLRQIATRANTGSTLALMVVSLDRGDTLFALNPDLRVAPASNMKLYSTAAALYYLGPDFRYSTYVLGAGEVRDGVLEGDLILYGTGDPAISGRMVGGSLTPLRALADSLVARGVREVRGDLIGDGSYFDAEWLGRGWSAENFGAWYSAPIGALTISENVASIRIAPGAVGGLARISTAPATEGFEVINRVITTAGGQTQVRFEYAPDGLIVTGRIARGNPGIARSMPIVNPTNFAAAAFRSVLQERGVSVHGQVRSVHEASDSPVAFARRTAGGTPEAAPPRSLGVHFSPPLSELIAVTNQVSHNLFAEALLKMVGRVALGEGSFDAGSRAVRYFLECEAGVDTTALAIVDGSGLSPLNRVTARTTIQLLDVMTRSEHWDVFETSLPQAGGPRPRGLQRMVGTPAARNLRAKTGTIHTVSSLSGYVRAANGERLAFSIIANNLPRSVWAAKRLEDAIGARLAEFRRPLEPGLVAETEPVEAEADAAPTADADTAGAAPEPVPPPSPAPRTYRIRPGDTLDGIARRHGTTVGALERANPGIDARRLRVGQTIRLQR